jgi:hypothetical protein
MLNTDGWKQKVIALLEDPACKIVHTDNRRAFLIEKFLLMEKVAEELFSIIQLCGLKCMRIGFTEVIPANEV